MENLFFSLGWVGLGVWVGLGGGGGVVFYFVDTVLFCRTVFVGRWVAMVLTSSSCNLGIDNFDSRQVPNLNRLLPQVNIKLEGSLKHGCQIKNK